MVKDGALRLAGAPALHGASFWQLAGKEGGGYTMMVSWEVCRLYLHPSSPEKPKVKNSGISQFHFFRVTPHPWQDRENNNL